MITLRTYVVAAALCVSPIVSNAAPVSADAQKARVITVVSSIPMAVDLGAYDLAERAFADEVTIDYTSLWGGMPVTMSPQSLMMAWQDIVPGFDATHHALSNVDATVSNQSATARADVDGRHWIGEQVWRPIGAYKWDLILQDGEWKVTRMVFEMTEEYGSRDLATIAMERAASAK